MSVNGAIRSKVPKAVSVSVLILFTVHLSLSILFTICPGSNTDSSWLRHHYQTKFLIGPFFTEERIRISAGLWVRYKTTAAGWSPFVNYAEEYKKDYWQYPWRYDKLKLSNYTRDLVRECYNSMDAGHVSDSARVSSYEKLKRFLLQELLPPEEMDSIELKYIFWEYQPPSNSVSEEVVWNITYAPDEISAD
jgi:hypothetical protein